MKNYINLIDKLSQLDKNRIINYINSYGINAANFIGVDAWLQNWSHSNQKLYKLLGNNFIYKTEYRYKRSEEELKKIFRDKLNNHNFIIEYNNFYFEYIFPLFQNQEMSEENKDGFLFANNIYNFILDKIQKGIKYKGRNHKKTLQIQPGMKPIKALQKIIEYFKDEYSFNYFDDFKKIHSLILNDNNLKGHLCFSIHPLDFMTMSDNNSNWSSCMSWVEEGCYRTGTIEMMNSNNVICCYLEAESPFCFNSDYEGEEGYIWNNKKWRSLVYITKDIIMSGKPYPYVNEDISKYLINTIKDLAKQNLNWEYNFGPELYKDMKYVNSEYPLDRSRNFIRTNNTKKHNILWDTKGMYNDMLNDHNTHYWCYRNKVKKNKVISVSGKAPCLCCGESIITYNDDNYENNYNERFVNYGDVICFDCQNIFYCDSCNEYSKFESYVTITLESGTKLKICSDCADKYIKYCPDCEKPMYIDHRKRSFAYKKPLIKNIDDPNICYSISNYYREDFLNLESYYQPICVCNECSKKYNNDLRTEKVTTFLNLKKIKILNDNKIKDKLLYQNLKSVPKKEYIQTILKQHGTESLPILYED